MSDDGPRIIGSPQQAQQEEQLAFAMQKARMAMAVQAMNAMREQMAAEIKDARLLVSIDTAEAKALQAGVAMAAVTAATLLTDKVIAAFTRRLDEVFTRFDGFEGRLQKLEAGAALVAQLGAKLEAATAAVTGMPPLSPDELAAFVDARTR